ncbi:MAG: hypothetical protein Q9165_008732 [Trypethelium subeluteriae]
MPSALVQELAAEVGQIVNAPFSFSLKVGNDTDCHPHVGLVVADKNRPDSTSPHAADSVLSQLLELLLKRADNNAVRQWSEEYPCQRRQLASVILDAFQTWPYALGILERLSENDIAQGEKFEEIDIA